MFLEFGKKWKLWLKKCKGGGIGRSGKMEDWKKWECGKMEKWGLEEMGKWEIGRNGNLENCKTSRPNSSILPFLPFLPKFHPPPKK